MPRLGMCSNNLNYLQNKTSRLKGRVTTSYLNFSLYPEYCILKTISLTFSTLLSHGNSLLKLSRTLRISWVSAEVVNSALKAYETREKADQEGERLLHRPREWKREERDQEKARKRSNWYKKGGNKAVFLYQLHPIHSYRGDTRKK